MTVLAPDVEEQLRQFFKQGNRFMLLMWRLGLGGWLNSSPEYGGQIMVLTHTGRKTGLQRHQPLNYILLDGDVYCVAGFGAVSDWYRNILANPRVEVWLPDGWWEGMAEDISASRDRLFILRELITASGFAGRIFGFNATQMSDEELAAATEKYRLIRIKRKAARTGKGGPGDLAWVWPVSTLVLLMMLFGRRRQR